MSKARRQMQEDVALIDVVIELVDARIPYSSKNPDIDRIAKNKSRIILMNKFDLADPTVSDQWRAYYESKGWFVANVNSKTGSGVKGVHEVIQQACKAKMERDRARGIMNRPIRAMIVGIPNVGKSTFINSFAGKACTKTGNKPGVTKGKQWICLNKEVELLDTPGILWPKFEDQKIGMRIAFIGSINNDILVQTDLAYELCKYLLKAYPGVLAKKYEIEEDEDTVIALERIAKKRGCLLKGGLFDLNKAAVFILDDFRNGRIARITLETPTTMKEEEHLRSLEEKKPIKRAAEKKAEAKELATMKREAKEVTRQSRKGSSNTGAFKEKKYSKASSKPKEDRNSGDAGKTRVTEFTKSAGKTRGTESTNGTGRTKGNEFTKSAGNTKFAYGSKGAQNQDHKSQAIGRGANKRGR
jgi:ribosome biogenesis GTPase A